MRNFMKSNESVSLSSSKDKYLISLSTLSGLVKNLIWRVLSISHIFLAFQSRIPENISLARVEVAEVAI